MKKGLLNLINCILRYVGYIVVSREWLRTNTFRIVDLRGSTTKITPSDILSFYSTQDLMYVINISTKSIARSRLLDAQVQTLKILEKENLSGMKPKNITESKSFKYLVDFYLKYTPRNVAERLELA